MERTAGAIFSVVSTVVLESCCAQDITALNQEEKFTSVSESEKTQNTESLEHSFHDLVKN